MATTIRQSVTVSTPGLIEIRSPDFKAGEHAEVIVHIEAAPRRASGTMEDLIRFAGAFKSGDPHGSNNESPIASSTLPKEDWRQFAGAINTGDPHSSNNERIDADLARAYGANNEPKK